MHTFNRLRSGMDVEKDPEPPLYDLKLTEYTMIPKTKLLPALLFILLISGSSFLSNPLQKSPEEGLIKAAILDYVEGVYNADTARIYKSVHPTLVKRGTWYDDKKADYIPLQEMSFHQLVNLTKRWNKDGSRANSSSPREIVIYDVQDKTATAKVTAAWGTDYFHLAKLDNKWYIMNVLWQSHPRT